MQTDGIQARRAARARESARRRQRRRRVLATVALLFVAAAVTPIVLALAVFSHHSSGSGARVAARRLAASRGRPAAARSPTPRSSGLGPATGHPGHAVAPILMYHVIAPAPANAPFPELYVPAAEFAAQMRALEAAGWVGVTLDELRANWRDGARLPPGKPIVITFDNGYHSQWAAALPVLRRLGWVADENLQLTGLPPSQGGLSSAEVRGLLHAGWELDTQGISHADLPDLSAAALAAQTAGARRTLERRYHVPVDWFCYPSGQYDATVVAALHAAGFVGSTTVLPGWARAASDPFRLPRLRVLGGTSPAALLAQIAGARDAGGPPSADLSSS